MNPYYIYGGPPPPPQIPYEFMAAAAAMIATQQHHIQLPPPANDPKSAYDYAQEFLRSVKRQRTDDEIRTLKEFTVEINNEGYEKLLAYIDYDLKIINALVRKNANDLAQWVRSQSTDEVFKILNNIRDDIDKIRKENFKFCKYNNVCKFKECCAGIHEPHMKSLVTCYNHVQYTANKFMERNTLYNASAFMRNLSLLEINLWSLVSRRRFGKY
jgi:hypothetical protein